jgi:hypothetical protein
MGRRSRPLFHSVLFHVDSLLRHLSLIPTPTRLVSHEIRTPLNAAYLGLRYLRDEMRDNLRSAEDEDRYETVKDIQTSCLTAIDILNGTFFSFPPLCLSHVPTSVRAPSPTPPDLLCFDKLENGMLELHTTDEPVVPFLTACVGMFSAQVRFPSPPPPWPLPRPRFLAVTHPLSALLWTGQAREKNITLQLVTTVERGSGSVAGKGRVESISPADVVKMDKFKVDQVPPAARLASIWDPPRALPRLSLTPPRPPPRSLHDPHRCCATS